MFIHIAYKFASILLFASAVIYVVIYYIDDEHSDKSLNVRKLVLKNKEKNSFGKSRLSLQEEYLELFRNTVLNVHYTSYDAKAHLYGAEWPAGSAAVSMAGQRRLDNFAALVAITVQERIPGHVIETGVWKGGAAFMAAKTIEVLGESSNRKVYLCDSFRGIPPPPSDRTYDFYDHNAQNLKILNENSVETVKKDAVKFGLDMSHLRFVVGFFNESLPELFRHEPDLKFSVIRLDGDTYFSTMDAIKVLYPRLSPGGFIIIDDFQDWPGCRMAIEKYREEEKITEPLVLVAHKQGEISRGVYWRKGPLEPGMGLCTGPHVSVTETDISLTKKGSTHKSLRPRNSYNPPNLMDMPLGGPKGVDVLFASQIYGMKYCAE